MPEGHGPNRKPIRSVVDEMTRYIVVVQTQRYGDYHNGTPQSEPETSDTADGRLEFARTLARGGMEGAQVISQTTADEVLTAKRCELIAELRAQDVDSVRGLARALERDKAVVSRDVKLLPEHGIVDLETDGRAKRPVLQHDHLVVEPVF